MVAASGMERRNESMIILMTSMNGIYTIRNNFALYTKIALITIADLEFAFYFSLLREYDLVPVWIQGDNYIFFQSVPFF